MDEVISANSLDTDDIRVLALDNEDGGVNPATHSVGVTPYQLSAPLVLTSFTDNDLQDLTDAVQVHLSASTMRLVDIEWWGTVGMSLFCSVTEAPITAAPVR